MLFRSLLYKLALLLLIDLKESLLLLIKPLNTLVKKPIYIIIPTEEVKLKKKIDGDVKEQNIVKKKKEN